MSDPFFTGADGLTSRLYSDNNNSRAKLSHGPGSMTSLSRATDPYAGTQSVNAMPVKRRNLKPKLTMSRSQPTLKHESSRGLVASNLSVSDMYKAAATENARHPLIKRKAPRNVPELPSAYPGEEVMADDASYLSDDSNATTRSFLSSLQLTAMQMASFIEDPGNFLYLSHKMGTNGMAYDLEVVDHSEISPVDYYTLSCSGITHFLGSSSDFTPLEQWEREYLLFGRMRKIPFFSKYRAWKNFTVWKKNVKAAKIATASGGITSNLFLFVPALRDALIEIKRKCVEIGESRLFDIVQGTTYTLEEFVAAQQAIQEELTVSLNDFSSDIHQIVRSACDDIVDQFLHANKIQADHKMTFMERASLRSECRKLTRFLRLTDFMVIDMLRDLAFESVQDALARVQPKEEIPRLILTQSAEEVAAAQKAKEQGKDVVDDGSYKPLFTVVVSHQEDGTLEVGPSARSFKEGFQNVVHQSLKVIGIPERVSSHEELAAYIMAENADAEEVNREEVPVQDIVSNDDQFESTTSEIYAALDEAFEAVEDYIDVFTPYQDTFRANAAYVDNIQDSYRENVDLDLFRSEIEKYTGMRTSFEGIPSAANIGIFSVDSIDLKMKLMPSPLLCLYALETLLPELIDEGATELNDRLGEVLPVIKKSPTNVDMFVKRKKVVATSNLEMQSYKDKQTLIHEMYDLMNQQGWVLDEKKKASLTIIDESVTSIENNIQIAEANEEEDTKRFAAEIETDIPVLSKDIVELRGTLDNSLIADMNNFTTPETVITFLTSNEEKLNAYRTHASELQDYQNVLNLEVTEFEVLEEVVAELKLKLELWHGVKDWSSLTADWEGTPLGKVDAESLEKQVSQYGRTVFKCTKNLPGNPVAPALKEQVDAWTPVLPLVTDLRNESLQERHWEQINDLVGFQIDMNDESFTLVELINRKVTDHADAITNIATTAVQESVLQEMMDKVTSMWKDTEIIVLPYKDVKDLYVLGDVSEIIQALDDSLVTVNTVLGSRYVGGIRDFVEGWRKNLILFQDTIDEWMTCQKGWMYLETIFSSPDIVRQLPAAAKMFQTVDKSWKAIMKLTNDDNLAIKACTVAGRRELFQQHNAALDKIQKNLEEYLETKRGKFARFYFLSNDELLEILSSAKDPQAVQPHLRKCFEALVRLDFGDDPGSSDIFGMLSPEKERVDLGKHLKARGNVEDWLTNVEDRMKSSLAGFMKAALIDYDNPDQARHEWVMCGHAGQLVATVAQMTWARDTENAIRAYGEGDKENGLEAWFDYFKKDLLKLIELIRTDLKKIHRKIIVALVTTDVHARDIIDELLEHGVSSVNNFTWVQQLRYYWEEPPVDTCIIQHSDARLEYGFEYMGATSRLVITPLTDRCWMTLTASYGLKLGAAPAGPAGTGKTESSKDLAKAIGIFCVVFNCSDQIDYKMMAKHFRGLAQSGTWTCLDEFNRIDIEVLSVVAQQMQVLTEGRVMGKPNINFMGIEIVLKDHHTIITMNPGYAGRTELPDNLAVCFRPVSMMVPNYALIAEIMLFAEGFGDAKTLARKMCKLYILCSEQLSQQPHYDYGLRAVKTVLVMAGGLKRENPDIEEDLVLIRALRDSNQPKFLADDIPLFQAIILDLFPGAVIPPNQYGEFATVMDEVLQSQSLQLVPKFQEKIIQMFDIFNIRFGATIVGLAGGGKSTIWRTLAKVMTELRKRGSPDQRYQEVTFSILNPKCITMGELYGETNEMTQEWHDGLASTIMRGYTNDESELRRWTVFDGPIDAIWIENMNTVLDDNMTLCLANGERIKLKIEMKCLFEVNDLAVASPATVSRIGVVYLTPTDLGWFATVKTWVITKLPEAMSQTMKDHLLALVEKYVTMGLKFQRKSCKEPVKCVDVNLVTSFCFIFESLCKAEKGVDFSVEDDVLKKTIEQLFAFAFVWSIGGSIDHGSWEKFDIFVKEGFEEGGLTVAFPPTDTVFDYFIDINEKEFVPWSKIIPAFDYDPAMPFFSLVVPTADTVRYSFLMQRMIEMDHGVFITGLTGTGKTAMVSKLLGDLEPPKEEGGMGLLPLFLGYSAQTSSLVTQATIEGKLEKKRKTLLGAPANRKVLIFVDDVNMPLTETYGAQPPVELLRQFLDFKGFYDRDKLFWKDIVDTIMFTGAAPPGGGRSEVTPRFARHFTVLCVPPSSDETMSLIFTSILDGFLKKFDPDVQKMAKGLVAGAIEVYNRISAELLPTPAKFHYTFNLRDISKVFQGVLMVDKRKIKGTDDFGKLGIHEIQRVFYDRLTNPGDQEWFANIIMEIQGRAFTTSYEADAIFGTKPIIFVDFLKAGADVKYYEEAPDMAKLTGILDDNLEEYNVTFSNRMNLVFFQDAVKHVARCSRVLRQPRGNAMLIGVGGIGKQSTTRIAAFVGGLECRMIDIVRGYGLNEFREDIKNFMIQTGVEGKPTVFLFTDSQIVVETMLEDINNLLNSGEIPNLFPQDEMDKICGDMIPVCKALGVPETRDNCISTFITRSRENLHIVLCMSPVGDALRIRCRNFPSLINCCAIDWYMSWPETALVSVAERYLANLELPSDEIRGALVLLCGTVHTSVAASADRMLSELSRYSYTTPKSYLDLINLYMEKLGDLQNVVKLKKEQMVVGVQKLEETNALVEGLRTDLKALEPVLIEKSIEAEAMLKQVAIDQSEASLMQEKVGVDVAEVAKQQEMVEAIAADAQKDLDVALPALNNAVKALDSLTKGDIVEVKGFKTPPSGVMLTMEAICIMLSKKPDWDTAKKEVLSDSQFLDKLKKYDKDNIDASILKKLQKYIVDEAFTPEAVGRQSTAAKGMCMWCHAMDVYSRVAKEVGPKKAKLEQLNAELKAANDKLAGKKAELQAVLDKVAELQRICDETMAEKTRLQNESDQTAERLVNAEKLTSGLASEGVRWKENIIHLTTELECLIGDTFLSCAAISYYGPFPGTFRDELVQLWQDKANETQIPCSEKYTLVYNMGDPVQIREWQNFGLPTDSVSTNSAVLVDKGKRWPLMIDPQGQANKWLKNMEEKAGLEATKMTDINLLRSLENCIRVGKPLLIEDIGETLEPALEPVLQKATFKEGNRVLIRLGDTNVDYDENFKLYLTTKMPNPHYLPEVCIKVTIVNFTVTMVGLEDQLLGDIVKKERPDVEERKVKLMLSMAADQKKLAEIEADILKRLSESTGNILDNTELIDTLATSKTTSSVIKERVQEAEKTEIEINETRNGYRRSARRGSIIYFVIADLAQVDPMYQYSLEYYQELFGVCVDGSEKSDDLETRLDNLIAYATFKIYENICRGLFERDKILFSSLVCFQILRDAGDIQSGEFNLLTRGAGAVDREQQPDNPKPGTIPDQTWDMLCKAETDVVVNAGEDDESYPFMGITKSLSEDWGGWHGWMTSDDPINEALPAPFCDTLNKFMKLLLIKAFRDEMIKFALIDYVGQAMGKEMVQSPAASMADIYADIHNGKPCIFILSKGADPTGMLVRFAKEMGYGDRLHPVSLGQGQGPYAEQLIENGCKTGDWVLLQNCMLAKSWMERLEEVCFGLQKNADENHQDFRLYLTSKPAAYFPVSVLQNGIKMTNEPPQGIRNNTTRATTSLIKEEYWESCTKPREWKKLLCGLAFFHANIQERRKFGPLGWNILYAFDESDLETSVAILRRFLDEQDVIPWDALRYVTGHINYGGRVTDDQDRRCLMTILGKHLNENILDDDYKFSESGTYYAPVPGKLNELLGYYDSLPRSDNPEVFGMHSNADVTYNRNVSTELMHTILALQPRDAGGGGGMSADEIVLELCANMAEQVPALLNEDDAGDTTFVMQENGLLPSLAIVLQQEMIKFNRLLNRMNSSLIDMKKAINGFIVMSGELDSMYTSCMNNQLPGIWNKVSFATLKTLASWLKDVIFRIDFLRTWLHEGEPKAFALPVFFFPQGFMTGALQTYARKYQQAIDTLNFKFHIHDGWAADVKESPEDGIICYGLFMEGARWDREKRLMAGSIPGEMYEELPPIHFEPAVRHKPAEVDYQCPLYKTSERKGVLSTTGMSTNYVVSVEFPTDKDPGAWVMSGVACLCNLTD